MSFFALLDDAVSGQAKYYQNYQQSSFLSAHELDALDAVLQQGWQNGWFALLCADYAFGLPLMSLPAEKSGFLAVHWFARCGATDPETWLDRHSDGLFCGISTPLNNVAEADYLHTVAEIHEAIRRGDTYQINYTTRLHFDTYGNPVDLYRRLRQPVPYAALCHLPDSDGLDTWTLCFSPELFLKIGSNGLITTEPMKGTAPILNDGLDSQRAAGLHNDPKNRAENIMIVDLLRNDLGKIAQTGSVRVPEPFKVSQFGSVWQMTSAIEAQARPHTRAADIFRAAFPCGSITGAPKRMSMHIIDRLETTPRGLYTGSIGFLNPCESGLGFEGVFNVVIRTLALRPSENDQFAADFHAEYGVGSGIVIDSQAGAEWAECGWKARFLTDFRPDFGIFETLRIEQNQCALLARHLGRLNAAAYALNLPLPADAAAQIRDYLTQIPSEPQRLKITLLPDNGGKLTLTHSPLPELNSRQAAIISDETLPVRDIVRRFKTTRREHFDDAWQTAVRHGAFDSLLFNSDGLLLEGGRSNVFVKINGTWHTPALDLDILNGVMRQEILDNPPRYLHADQVCESHITRAMLQRAETICLSNALRGVFEVDLI
ncbi:bifunctional chorismate-binding protein/class IV aminotransferase [Neisseria iguanae]|uniref:Bifunctional aminodeoxychorismate synthase component I/aminodeoxychorismate lyase n=1 Tax=Neisseria iguanae TaxID=90242 RepID=A0A2P7TXS3_9NEIS|nr:bifunctional chorismate-binding protein/class IV aminotransferase [Neisseria iguanae]PSJ79529.1 bifunctional aminodeoxychorismate synthase component I/aminodeoxychorismate lyase [Neisseria iguanae]